MRWGKRYFAKNSIGYLNLLYQKQHIEWNGEQCSISPYVIVSYFQSVEYVIVLRVF